MLLFGGANDPMFMVGVFISVLVGMTVHEFAHNYVAYLMGDPTPKEQGRLTLDPMVHIYWPGFIMFVLIGFGILGYGESGLRNETGHLGFGNSGIDCGIILNWAL